MEIARKKRFCETEHCQSEAGEPLRLHAASRRAATISVVSALGEIIKSRSVEDVPNKISDRPHEHRQIQ